MSVLCHTYGAKDEHSGGLAHLAVRVRAIESVGE